METLLEVQQAGTWTQGKSVSPRFGISSVQYGDVKITPDASKTLPCQLGKPFFRMWNRQASILRRYDIVTT